MQTTKATSTFQFGQLKKQSLNSSRISAPKKFKEDEKFKSEEPQIEEKADEPATFDFRKDNLKKFIL